MAMARMGIIGSAGRMGKALTSAILAGGHSHAGGVDRAETVLAGAAATPNIKTSNHTLGVVVRVVVFVASAAARLAASDCLLLDGALSYTNTGVVVIAAGHVQQAGAATAPLLLTALVGLCFVALLIEVQGSELSAKSVALLGVLAGPAGAEVPVGGGGPAIEEQAPSIATVGAAGIARHSIRRTTPKGPSRPPASRDATRQ